jgi:hypothetical protein
VSFKQLQKVIFSCFLNFLDFSVMPWNLNPCFPLVIPSGPRDTPGDLAQSPRWTGSSSQLVGSEADFAATWQALASFAAFWSPLTSSLGDLRPFLPHNAALAAYEMKSSCPFCIPGTAEREIPHLEG